MTSTASIKTNKTVATTEAITTTTLLFLAFAEDLISGVTVTADRSVGLDVGSTLGPV